MRGTWRYREMIRAVHVPSFSLGAKQYLNYGRGIRATTLGNPFLFGLCLHFPRETKTKATGLKIGSCSMRFTFSSQKVRLHWSLHKAHWSLTVFRKRKAPTRSNASRTIGPIETAANHRAFAGQSLSPKKYGRFQKCQSEWKIISHLASSLVGLLPPYKSIVCLLARRNFMHTEAPPQNSKFIFPNTKPPGTRPAMYCLSDFHVRKKLLCFET